MDLQLHSSQIATHLATAIINDDITGLSNDDLVALRRWQRMKEIYIDDTDYGYWECEITGYHTQCTLVSFKLNTPTYNLYVRYNDELDLYEVRTREHDELISVHVDEESAHHNAHHYNQDV